jgi:HEAT repeat protein
MLFTRRRSAPMSTVCSIFMLLPVATFAAAIPQPEAVQPANRAVQATQESTPSAEETNRSIALAWQVLKGGIADHNAEKRATAIRVLGLMPNNPQAVGLAEKALEDEKPEVRTAAAFALGEMGSKHSIPLLRRALNDKETSVVLAAAGSLRSLRDPAAYRVYYEVLTGERKSGGGLLSGQQKMLRDPKKMALFGFEEGIGYIPFAGLGFHAVKALAKDDTSPVRAAAAKALANDPDPRSAKALSTAASDKSWIVRAAALDALAHRGDPAFLATAIHSMEDDKDAVRFTAAATALRLAALPVKRQKPRSRKH